MIDLKILITGTGRCGTVFLARLLTSLGIPCGHETVFDYRGLEIAKDRLQQLVPCGLSQSSTTRWNGKKIDYIGNWVNPLIIQAESSYLATPYLNDPVLATTKIVHVVRHPIRVINSFVNYINYFHKSEPSDLFGHAYERFIWQHLPDMALPISPYERAALYYVQWNKMIEENSKEKDSILVKIESGVPKLLEWLDLEPKPDMFSDPTVNTYEKAGIQRFSLSLLTNGPIKDRLIEIGNRYGYIMSSEYLLL